MKESESREAEVKVNGQGVRDGKEESQNRGLKEQEIVTWKG